MQIRIFENLPIFLHSQCNLSNYFQVELKLCNVETYFQKEMLIQRKKQSEEDHFDSLETISNEFTYGNFQWTLRLRPQPLLIPTNIQPSQTSSWASPIQKVLQQQRLGTDLDHLGLLACLERHPSPNLNNKINSG